MKTKHRKRTPRIFLSALLTLVLAISIAAPLQALAAGDDVFYMSVSGTLRYDYANEVASLTNQQRAANGQAALQLDPVLTERAMLRAGEISRIFEHTRPNGQDCSSVLDGTQFEFGGTGENIAMGTAWFFSPSIAMESWMNSSGHRANILGSSYQSLGVGVAVDSATGMACYVQLFSTLPASGGSVSNGTVEYNSFVEGSDNCPYYNEIMGPTYLYYMSPVFDADYYMEANPDTDVLTGGYDAGAAFTHFLDYGMAEGRRGNEEFDVNSYRNQYGDLRAAYGDDLISYYLHYIDYGRSEGRQGSGYTGPAVPSDPGTPSTPGGSRLTVYEGRDYASVYDYDYYISHNGDVAAAFGGDQAATLRQFVLYGMAEGRQGSENFDVNSYKNEYADLRAAYGDDLASYYLHYVDYGAAEGRHGTGCNQLMGGVASLDGVDYSAVYNYDYYISHNGDVAAAFAGDDVAALRHFVRYGMAEGRQGCEGFDVNSYKNEYADLRAAYGGDLTSYYLHYVDYGAAEGRHGTGCNQLIGAVTSLNGVDYSAVYNYDYYISHNGDIAAAFGGDDVATLRHFVQHGMAEGRQGCESFNVNVYRDRYGDLQQTYGGDTAAYYLHYLNYGRTEGRSGI